MDASEKTAIGRSTGITIGLAFAVIGAAVAGAWRFGNWTGADRAWKNSTELQLQSISARLESIESKALANRWTSIDQLRWTQRLQKDNPDLNVPEPVVR